MIEPKVQKLVDLIGYQEGAVVSREILRKKVGTITLFAFDKEQGLSEHKAPYDALLYLLDGEAKITVLRKPYYLKAGDSIILPANEPHAVNAIRRFKMLLIMVRA